MAKIIFIDTRFLMAIEDRTSIDSDVIPRAGDSVLLPGERHSQLLYPVESVDIHFDQDPVEVWARLGEPRDWH
jgi:hypothetical protein